MFLLVWTLPHLNPLHAECFTAMLLQMPRTNKLHIGSIEFGHLVKLTEVGKGLVREGSCNLYPRHCILRTALYYNTISWYIHTLHACRHVYHAYEYACIDAGNACNTSTVKVRLRTTFLGFTYSHVGHGIGFLLHLGDHSLSQNRSEPMYSFPL